ncbi:hypothetical protein H6P81_009619 [Aristolochia fimbriata]|uniref:GATA-type domain-containing protein n=1 Tax=Aristolochia fimbriata TaxID=158543 RepID=A0AAV7EM09_ARIFI|nr:hypothetical protein H6P81_009619 [Aristolochia fimbriata]
MGVSSSRPGLSLSLSLSLSLTCSSSGFGSGKDTDTDRGTAWLVEKVLFSGQDSSGEDTILHHHETYNIYLSKGSIDMHRCGSSTGGGSRASSMGPCACGLFHPPGSSFCVLFAMPTDESDEHFTGGCPSPVDCTLSLGTPSTRRGDEIIRQRRRHNGKSSCGLSNFCWDIFQAKQQAEGSHSHSHKNGRGGSGSNMQQQQQQHLNHLTGGETLLARRCANCDTTSTPLWRNGPRGPKSLCNACGIRYKKEERRASTTVVEMNNNQHTDPYAWSSSAAAYASASQSHKGAASSSAEFRLIREADHHETSSPDVSFLSWRLNVRDRAGLLHDFT